MAVGLTPRGFPEDWSSERDLSAFRLGDVLNIQAEVGAHSHVPLRLFVDSCVASLGPGAGTEPHYAIIDFNGCLVDGRSDATSSAFVTPRPRQDVLRFQIDAFRFAGDPRDTPLPDALNKACSFSKGTRDICSCCELGNCGQRGLRAAEPWSGHRYRRHDGDGEGTLGTAWGHWGYQGQWDMGTLGTSGHGTVGTWGLWGWGDPPHCPSLSPCPQVPPPKLTLSSVPCCSRAPSAASAPRATRVSP
uniref:ZP domain-containing protein n=1 Tax=Serinus canaria TaxID=9135 RepID=A0A8C9NTF4_SERCA